MQLARIRWIPAAWVMAAGGLLSCGGGLLGDRNDENTNEGGEEDSSGNPGNGSGSSLDAWDPGREPEVTRECLEPSLPAGLAIHTNGGADFTATESWVVLTGTAPAAAERITVNGSSRSVRFDRAQQRWSYHGPLQVGTNRFEVTAMEAEKKRLGTPVSVTITHPGEPSAERVPTLGPGQHVVGAWMFPWFTGDDSWECESPWWPLIGFENWDGSVRWARSQLLDMMDANLDLVGIQYDTKEGTSDGPRWTNVQNVMRAAADLLQEGYRPPRILMFLDTAIVSRRYRDSHGSDLDVSTSQGLDYLYDFVSRFYGAADEIFGNRYKDAAIAQYNDRPMLSFWTSSYLNAENGEWLVSLKERFASEFGQTAYIVGHHNDFRDWAATDELTMMLGPSHHFLRGGRDGAGKDTINITPGFWNPTGGDGHYLERGGGGMYAETWETTLAARGEVDHVYIDTWNETGEGSGIFEGADKNYSSSFDGYDGDCSGTDWIDRHTDSWGPSPRYYIDVTAAGAARWNDVPEQHAVLIAHDVPTVLPSGARRLATVVVRNAGDRAWEAGEALSATHGQSWTAEPKQALSENEDGLPHYGGLFRGRPRAFTFELLAPCTAGTYHLEFRMTTPDGITYGDAIRAAVTVQ